MLLRNFAIAVLILFFIYLDGSPGVTVTATTQHVVGGPQQVIPPYPVNPQHPTPQPVPPPVGFAHSMPSHGPPYPPAGNAPIYKYLYKLVYLIVFEIPALSLFIFKQTES